MLELIIHLVAFTQPSATCGVCVMYVFCLTRALKKII